MDDLPTGWKKGATNTSNDSLFKIYKTNDIEVTYNHFNRISGAILNSSFRSSTFITMSNDVLTVTINDLGDKKTLKEMVAFAQIIDSLIEVQLQ